MKDTSAENQMGTGAVYPEKMTNEQYREGLRELFDGIDDNQVLRYFYIFCTEKVKRE